MPEQYPVVCLLTQVIPAKPLHNHDIVSVHFNHFHCMGICHKLRRHTIVFCGSFLPTTCTFSGSFRHTTFSGSILTNTFRGGIDFVDCLLKI